jgi:hypothetical protein
MASSQLEIDLRTSFWVLGGSFKRERRDKFSIDGSKDKKIRPIVKPCLKL